MATGFFWIAFFYPATLDSKRLTENNFFTKTRASSTIIKGTRRKKRETPWV